VPDAGILFSVGVSQPARKADSINTLAAQIICVRDILFPLYIVLSDQQSMFADDSPQRSTEKARTGQFTTQIRLQINLSWFFSVLSVAIFFY
jgi:hypothetical protein